MVRSWFSSKISKKLKREISGGQDINTTAYYSCSTILNDEMLVFGGTEPGDYTKQVHISFQKGLIWHKH